jgi:hypothetical protein
MWLPIIVEFTAHALNGGHKASDETVVRSAILKRPDLGYDIALVFRDLLSHLGDMPSHDEPKKHEKKEGEHDGDYNGENARETQLPQT